MDFEICSAACQRLSTYEMYAWLNRNRQHVKMKINHHTSEMNTAKLCNRLYLQRFELLVQMQLHLLFFFACVSLANAKCTTNRVSGVRVLISPCNSPEDASGALPFRYWL